MKLKSMPSEKIKRRYISIEALNKEIVGEALLDYIGILGWAKASPVFVNYKKSKLITLSIERDWLTHARAAFALSSKEIKVKRVSGTLAGLI